MGKEFPLPMSAFKIRSQVVLASAVCALLMPGVAAATQRLQATAQPAPTTAPATVFVEQDQDARETREKLEELMKRLPPAVGRVLKLDPSLMSNEGYMATYPALVAFLKQHPEVKASPGYFFEHVGSYEFWNPSPPESREAQAVRVWRDIMQFFAVASIFIVITGALIWIIRTLVEYRRWYRTSRIHTDVHNKLMDRFTSNEDLMAYIQTPAGRRFLESAPISVEGPVRPVGAPFGRILWSVQVGVVLAAGALGLLFVSNRVIDEVAQPLFAIGVLALTVGAGFVVSAGASFLLSRRLGLLEPAGPPREHSEAEGR
jgi:hypothetical protein